MNLFHRANAMFAASAACLALALSGAGSAAAASTTFTGQVNLQNQTNLSNIYLLYNGNNGAITGDKYFPSNFGLTSIPFNVSDNASINSGYATAIALYHGNARSTGVVVALNSTAGADALGKSFDSVFGVSETTLEGYLQSNDTASLQSFLNANSADFLNYMGDGSTLTGSILDFSNGALGGSIMLSAVASDYVAPTPIPTPTPTPASSTPEPATYALMGLGFAAAAVAKFRNRFGRIA